MKLIAHRGNISGPKPEQENSLDYVEKALKQFDCEIDVWLKGGEYYLGHDRPQYLTPKGFLNQPNLWCHAKNIAALIAMRRKGIHCLWHEKDKLTLTSRGFIWLFPQRNIIKEAINLMPEKFSNNLKFNCVGICSDYIENYR